MKTKRFLVLAAMAAMLLPQAAQADSIVAGWDTFDSNTAPAVDTTAFGVSGTAALTTSSSSWSTGESNSRGSTPDTTWGTFAGPAAASSVTTTATDSNLTLTNARTDGTITLTLVNNGTSDVELNDFHFDALAFRPKAPRTWAVSVLGGGAITAGTLYTSGAPMNDNSTDAITHLGGALTNGGDQHDDIDLSAFAPSLSSLADNTLEIGGTAVIELAFTNGVGDNSGGHHLFVDNIGVSGDIVSTIPEPSSLALLGFGGLGLLLRRRR